MTESTPPLAQLLMEMSEKIAPITEFVMGERAKLEAAGYSPTVAEQLAAEMHVALLRKVFA